MTLLENLFFRGGLSSYIVCNNKNIRLKNGITGQTGFTNASGHVDVVYNRKAAGGEHGAVYYYNEGAHTLIWKYRGFRK